MTRRGRARAILTFIAMAGGSAVALAQETAESKTTGLSDVFQRLEQQDREAKQEGLLLQKSTDPGRDASLSIGTVGVNPSATPFDSGRPDYLLDPETPPETPPIGFRLKLKF